MTYFWTTWETLRLRLTVLAYGNVILKQIDRKLNAETLNFWATNGYRGSSFIADEEVSIVGLDKTIKANNISYDDIVQK
ncbi:MAG: hypothetical protein VB855_16245, partial [Pirellulaceae bacterium]